MQTSKTSPVKLSRREFLKFGGTGVASAAVLSSPIAAFAKPTRGPAHYHIPLNIDWRFGGPLVVGSTRPGFDDSGFARVTLPHTVTDLSWRRWDPASWQKTWIYRRHFDLPELACGRRVFVDFAGAMTGATLALNGARLQEHLGGYLPFSDEITDQVKARDNVLAVALNARFDINVPPDKPDLPPTSVDFWQPGGLYREASLKIVPQTFISEVFAKPVNVLDAERRVEVQCRVDAAHIPKRHVHIKVELRDRGKTIAQDVAPIQFDKAGQKTVALKLANLGNIALWDVHRPRLYDVVATLVIDKTGWKQRDVVHVYCTRIGFREARFTKQGFFLNGKRIKLFGLNRHQLYPFAGMAMPERVQRKDAEILKHELNCNMVRCSHYPQSEAFLDACDELGLMAWEEAPGWGRSSPLDNKVWAERVARDVHAMVVRDRNHPAIVIWGARLNETSNDVKLYTKTRNLAHALDDSRPTTGAMIGGLHNTRDFVQDVFSYNDYHRAHGHAALRPPRTDFPYLVSEAVGTLSGPAKIYRRTAAMIDQQGQALAHAWVHELAASDPRYCGLLAWSGYDYESGSGNMDQGVKYTGVVDLFRIPKPGAAIYQAQIDPQVRPVIAPAFYWDFGKKSLPYETGQEAMICANCERLELFVDDEPYAEIKPDRKRFASLPYPPFFVDLNTIDGAKRPELRVEGYVGNKRLLSRKFSSDPASDRLILHVDDGDLIADGSDATRVMFRAVDSYGAPRPYVTGAVRIAINGPAKLVGESPFAFAEAGGVGAVWIRTIYRQPGKVRVKVSHPTLGTYEVVIHVYEVRGHRA